MRLGGRSRLLAALLLVVVVVLSPLRAMAATIPVLFAYDVAASSTSTSTVRVGKCLFGGHDIRRPH